MDVDRVLRKLEVSSSAAEQSVSLLRQIDLAKSRMEEACSVLKVTCLPAVLTFLNLLPVAFLQCAYDRVHTEVLHALLMPGYLCQ